MALISELCAVCAPALSIFMLVVLFVLIYLLKLSLIQVLIISVLAAVLPLAMFSFSVCCTGLCDKSQKYFLDDGTLHFIDGCFGHTVKEITLEKVTEIKVKQRLGGKVFNHGNLEIYFEDKDPLHLRNISWPHFHRRIIQERLVSKPQVVLKA